LIDVIEHENIIMPESLYV